MSEMSEFWHDSKIEYKKRCERRNNKNEPELLKLGAIQKANGVYELDDWFLYPTKGFAMNKKNTRQRMNLQIFINERKINK